MERVNFYVAPRYSRNIQEPPQINVTFADNSIDYLELTHYKMKDKSPIRCNYQGRLRQNPSSIVAVTGCLNKPGDKMEVTMFSEKAKHKMFSVDFNGNTEPIKGPFEDGGLRSFNFNIFLEV